MPELRSVGNDKQRRPCPICQQAADDDIVLRDYVSREHFMLACCRACGHGFIAEPPPVGQIWRYYQTPAGAKMHGRANPLARRLQRLLLLRELRLLGRLSAGDLVVDIGSGDGAAAAVLAEQAASVLALDGYPASHWQHAKIAYRQVDFNAVASRPDGLGELPGSGRRLAVMRHVLEHLHQPEQFLRNLARQRFDTVLLVVPNFHAWLRPLFGQSWYYWDPPRHLHQFTETSLRAAASHAGFDVDYLGRYGIDEIVTSLYRWLEMRAQDGKLAPRWLRQLCAPKGALAGLASAAAYLPGNTVIMARLRRRANGDDHAR
ncbi:methyltransferase domain-containing protein [Chitinimonas sp.]|uniref:methyltransferase domain-containing protein n=1 Tax=Chitinimonas sp. TaxID=1934313 RepID=UPI0035B10AC4